MWKGQILSDRGMPRKLNCQAVQFTTNPAEVAISWHLRLLLTINAYMLSSKGVQSAGKSSRKWGLLHDLGVVILFFACITLNNVPRPSSIPMQGTLYSEPFVPRSKHFWTLRMSRIAFHLDAKISRLATALGLFSFFFLPSLLGEVLKYSWDSLLYPSSPYCVHIRKRTWPWPCAS